jgi:hypothetical protein
MSFTCHLPPGASGFGFAGSAAWDRWLRRARKRRIFLMGMERIEPIEAQASILRKALLDRWHDEPNLTTRFLRHLRERTSILAE